MGGLFLIAVIGTAVLPLWVAIVAWRSAREARGRRMLAATAAWLALCLIAGVVCLATDDAYYAPNHVTRWASATAGERQTIVILLALTGAAALVLLAASRRRLRITADAALVGVAWAVDVVMMLTLLALGLH